MYSALRIMRETDAGPCHATRFLHMSEEEARNIRICPFDIF